MPIPSHEIVVSAENNPYLAWQAMLFHYSCVKLMGRPPIVMVHKEDEPLLPEFELIRESGGIVQTAPNYRRQNGVDYPPRNTAGSLRHVETAAEYIVLCDPDMFFIRPFPFDELRLNRRQVSFDFVGYLNPDLSACQPALDDVCRRAGIRPDRLRNPVVNGGVPHVIPKLWQERLSREWLELIECFPTIRPLQEKVAGVNSPEVSGGPQKDWLATMWAIVLAMHRLDLEPVMTKLCVTNFDESRRLDATESPTLVHYCYGGPGFNKRMYTKPRDAEETVWNVAPQDGSVAGMIRQHLRNARRFYGLPEVELSTTGATAIAVD